MPTYSVTGLPLPVDDYRSTLVQVQNTGAVPVLVGPLGRQVAPGGTVTVPGWSQVATTVQTAGQGVSTVVVTLTAGSPAAQPGPGAVTFDSGGLGAMTVTITGGNWFTNEGLTTAAAFPVTVAAGASLALYPAAEGPVTVSMTVGTVTKAIGLNVSGSQSEGVSFSDHLTRVETVNAGTANAGTGTFAALASVRSVAQASGTLAQIPASGIVPVNLRNWRKALAKVDSGTGSARMLCVGDSTTMGVGASPTGGGVSSYPGQLRSLLNGYRAASSYTFGIPQQAGSNDGRWTPAGGWGFGQAVSGNTKAGFGARSYYYFAGNSGSPGTDTLTYAPGVTCDTIVIYTARGTTNPNNIPVTIDGVSQTAINAQGAAGWLKTTYTVASGTHTVVLGGPTGGTGGNTFILGIEAYLSTASEIRVMNAGVGSATSNDWITSVGGNVFAGHKGIEAVAPDLTAIMLGINDSIALVSSGTLTSQLQTLITSAKVSGDCILMSTTPADPSQTGASLEAGYATAIQALAASNGCGFIDIYNRQGSYAANAAAGRAADVIGHLTAAGYLDVATAVFDTLRAVA